MQQKEFINSKIECPVCTRTFAKNYLMNHLKNQHNNIFGTPAWDDSVYAKNFEKIKKDHKDIWKKKRA